MTRMAKLYPRTWLILVVGILALVGGFALAQAPVANAAMKLINRLASPSIPTTFNYQGYLRNQDGTLVTGTRNITVRIYDSASGGTTIFTESFGSVNVRDGIFNVILGDFPSNPLGATFDATPRFIGVTVNSDPELTPRERVHGVPWAIHASNAAKADLATNATNASQANFATSASQASSADEADDLTEIGCCDLYSAGSTSSPTGASQTLNTWNNINPNTSMCFLSKVQTAAFQAVSCEIKLSDQKLYAGPYNYCEALCVTFGNN